MKYIKKKYLIYLSLGIIAVFSVIIFGTYAIFQASTAQNTTNVVSTLDCMNITITGNNSALTLNNAYPLLDRVGVTKTPYNFTVKNNCNTTVQYQIVVSIVNTSTLNNLDYIKVDIDGLEKNRKQLLSNLPENTISGLTGYLGNYTLVNNTFNNNESHTYNFRMWLNGENEDIWEDDTITSKNFTVKLSIIGVMQSDSFNTLKEQILAQGGGAAAIEVKPTPSFNVINGTSGLYSSPDEYGMSYYYRGVKEELNNNLIWGGFQWKIVRINGDGSVRLIYNGTEAQFNQSSVMNDTGANTQITTAAWNSANYNDAKYVGYMYGGANGVASEIRHGSTSLAATFNQTSTNIKNVLENWYGNNIAGKPHESDVVDNLFCNDRQLRSEVGGTSTGLGYGNTGTSTYYAAYQRLNTTKAPTLQCGLKNDRFTKSDTTLGNGALTYPVGLLTADETSMAGLVYGSSNSTNYLYTNSNVWLFSPGNMISSGSANAFLVNSSGRLVNYRVTDSYGVRPAVSINSKTRVTGSGSNVDPYKVV